MQEAERTSYKDTGASKVTGVRQVALPRAPRPMTVTGLWKQATSFRGSSKASTWEKLQAPTRGERRTEPGSSFHSP